MYGHEIHPHGEAHWKKHGSFPGCPRSRLVLPTQGASVQSLVKKLQSHTPRGIAKKKKKKNCVNHWNFPVSPVVKTLSFHYRGYRLNPSAAKKERQKYDFQARPHFMYFYSVHNSYLCIPPQKTFTDSLYYIVAVSILKYYPPLKKGRGKVYSHHGQSSSPGKTLARL